MDRPFSSPDSGADASTIADTPPFASDVPHRPKALNRPNASCGVNERPLQRRMGRTRHACSCILKSVPRTYLKMSAYPAPSIVKALPQWRCMISCIVGHIHFIGIS